MLEGRAGPPVSPPTNTSRIFNNKVRLLFIGLVLVLALGYLIYAAFPGSTLYYLTVDEFLADESNLDGRGVRVVGKLVPGSLQRVEDTPQKDFTITEEGEVLRATYAGPLPGPFENPHSDIVLEGSYGEGGVFNVDTVIVKCPSKYQALRAEG